MPFFKMPDVFYTTPVEPTNKKLKYGKKPSQFLNVRIPNSDGPHPTIFVIHGGQWKKAYTHKQMEYLCEDLKTIGIATINIEFRRLGHVDGGHPTTFTDLHDAIQHVLTHNQARTDWNLDTTRLSLLGHSSGAHLAFCLAGTKINERELSFKLKSLIGLAGVYNLDTASPKLQPLIKEFFGTHKPLSPHKMLPQNTPTLVLVGDKDKLTDQAKDYATLAKAPNKTMIHKVIPNCTHFRIIDPTHPHWPQIRTAIKTIAT